MPDPKSFRENAERCLAMAADTPNPDLRESLVKLPEFRRRVPAVEAATPLVARRPPAAALVLSLWFGPIRAFFVQAEAPRPRAKSGTAGGSGTGSTSNDRPCDDFGKASSSA